MKVQIVKAWVACRAISLKLEIEAFHPFNYAFDLYPSFFRAEAALSPHWRTNFLTMLPQPLLKRNSAISGRISPNPPTNRVVGVNGPSS